MVENVSVAHGARIPAGIHGAAGRILVKEVNWLGDLVISLPALRAIRAGFPLAKLAVMVKRELAGFFDGMAWVDEVIPYTIRRGWPSVRDRLHAIGKIRAGKFDLAVLFPNSFESALWATLAGVPRRAGFIADGRGPMLTYGARPDAAAMNGHQSAWWLEMVRATLGIATPPEPEVPRLEVARAHEEKMRAWLAERRVTRAAPLIALAPAAAYGPAKEWPAVRFTGLIEMLHERFGAECVMVGAPGERELCEKIAISSRPGAIVAAGETGIGELIALLSLCDGFAGNDSGAMHLSAALGIPAIGIFGSTNPDRTGPRGPRAGFVYHRVRCSPCLARTCRYGHYDCLRGVTVEEVAGALMAAGALAGVVGKN
jgi:heptosyltransferase-2